MMVLASRSPRRKEILQELGVDFIIHPSNSPENIDDSKSIIENAKALALEKAVDVAEHYPQKWVLGVDTFVVINGKITGKPADQNEATTIIRALNNNTVDVVSGIALINGDMHIVESETTKVHFAQLSEPEIKQWIDSGVWKDKSGGFTIQYRGSLYITGIEGDYYNVVGLPIYRFGCMCKQAGIVL